MTERTKMISRAATAALLGTLALGSLGCPSQPVTVCRYSTAGNCFDPNLSFNFDDNRVDAMDLSALPAAPILCREPTRARVLRVVDGDTFDVVFDDGITENVRLIGVDTPETFIIPPNTGLPRCYADEAKRFTQTLIGRRVAMTFDQVCVDRGDRTLAYVWLGPTRSDLWQTQLVRRGYAWQSTFPPNVNFSALFGEDEAAARAIPIGWWAECTPQTPTNP